MSTVAGLKMAPGVASTFALAGNTGTGVTLTAIGELLTSPENAVILAVPGRMPVTTPLSFTVATVVASDAHVTTTGMGTPFWSRGAERNTSRWPTSTVDPPLIAIDVRTCGVTVMTWPALMLPDAALIVAVPAETPVTSPVAPTVATPVAFDDQVIGAAKALPNWSFGDPVS
jgi:hypothetical protein